jgi:hypothetical protein
MDKIWARLLFTLGLACSEVVEGAYIVKLQSGREFSTGRYWYAGTQLMLELEGGGVLGVDRSSVATIEESNKPLRPTLPVQRSDDTKRQAPASDNIEHGNAPAPLVPKYEVNREEDPILKDFDVLKEKSKTLAGMLTADLQEFSKKLTELKRTIQRSGKTNSYLREMAQISEMGDMVEGALKSIR